MRSRADLGGIHIQFPFTSRDSLLDAREYAEEYRSLVVRVAGYSALFVNLSKPVQDQVIVRTVHAHPAEA